MSPAPRIAVVGGGVSGLAAAYRLRRLLGSAARIRVIEQSGRLGGALRTTELAGVAYDLGAEAFLVRRPEAAALVSELGLGDDLVHPRGATASIRAAGRSMPLPTRTVMGLPGTPEDVAGVLSPSGLSRLAAEPGEPLAWEPGADPAIGPLVRHRAGDEVVDRLIDPLLGGVYGGRADGLGLRSTLPGMAGKLDQGAPSLLAAAAAALPAPSPAMTPVFGTVVGGLGRVAQALAAASGAELSLGMPACELARTERGWRVGLGSAAAGGRREVLEVDAVLLAVPPPALRRLLADPLPAAAAAAGRVEVASSVVVGLALPAARAQRLPDSSGVLIASGEPHAAKAFTFSSRKWEHLRGEDTLLVRASLGRHGEEPALQRDDGELVAAVLADLAEMTGLNAEPVDTAVARWGGGLPQYSPGHVDTVAALEQAVCAAPGLAIAGAALHGVGIPACIATADAAAMQLVAHLTSVAPQGETMGRWRA